MERFLVAQSVEKEAFHPVPRARGITKWRSLSGVSRQSLERLSGKCWANLMVAYALHYGEQEIPYGSVRRRVALHRPASARPHRAGTP